MIRPELEPFLKTEYKNHIKDCEECQKFLINSINAAYERLIKSGEIDEIFKRIEQHIKEGQG